MRKKIRIECLCTYITILILEDKKDIENIKKFDWYCDNCQEELEITEEYRS